MFRKPREQPLAGVLPPKPSVGRPPTPPPPTTVTTMPSGASRRKSGQSQLSSFFNKAAGPLQAQTKSQQPQNDSILKFFKKVDAPAHYERSLFIGGDTTLSSGGHAHGYESISDDVNGEDDPRFNENCTPQKRRRVTPPVKIKHEQSEDARNGALHEHDSRSELQQEPANGTDSVKSEPQLPDQEIEGAGPFAEDSESEDERLPEEPKIEKLPVNGNGELRNSPSPAHPPLKEPPPDQSTKPTLTREATSFFEEDDFGKFEDLEEDEFYEGGEEYLERKYMEEQAALEQEFEEDDLTIQEASDIAAHPDTVPRSEEADASCPICNASLSGITPHVRSVMSYIRCH